MNITKNLGMLLLAIYSDTRRSHSAASHHHPDYRNGNPSAGSGHFDSHRAIANPLRHNAAYAGRSVLPPRSRPSVQQQRGIVVSGPNRFVLFK